MENTQILALVGMPGAGKSFCTDYLVKQGFPSVYFGGITIDEIKAHGLEVNEANEKKVREGLRSEDKGIYAKRIIEQIEDLVKDKQKKIVVDGLYTWTEYKIFKQKFGDEAVVVAIVAPRKLRHKRLKERPVRPLSESEAISREYAEIENMEKGGPIANADYTVINDSTPEKFLSEVEKILAEVGFTI